MIILIILLFIIFILVIYHKSKSIYIDNYSNQNIYGDYDRHDKHDKYSRYIILLKSDNPIIINQFINEHKIIPTNIFRYCFNAIVAYLSKDQVKDLIKNNIVDFIQEDVNYKIFQLWDNDIDEGLINSIAWGIISSGVQHITSQDVSKNVQVFILDSGIDRHNTELNIVECLNFEPSDFTCDDKYGHGTHMAGIIGGKNTVYHIGVAPGASIHALKVYPQTGEGPMSTIISGIEYVIKYKLANPNIPVVVNMSLGYTVQDKNYNVLDKAVLNAINRGIICCVAGGNQGENADFLSPAHVKEVIAVGAYDINNKFTDYSGYGPSISILAPGTNIVSTYFNNSYRSLSGSSMSVPYVVGIIVLYLSKYPNATPAQVKQALLLNKNTNFLILNVPEDTTNVPAFIMS